MKLLVLIAFLLTIVHSLNGAPLSQNRCLLTDSCVDFRSDSADQYDAVYRESYCRPKAVVATVQYYTNPGCGKITFYYVYRGISDTIKHSGEMAIVNQCHNCSNQLVNHNSNYDYYCFITTEDNIINGGQLFKLDSNVRVHKSYCPTVDTSVCDNMKDNFYSQHYEAIKEAEKPKPKQPEVVYNTTILQAGSFGNVSLIDKGDNIELSVSASKFKQLIQVIQQLFH